MIEVPKWAIQLPFNPSGSSPCTLDYLKSQGYKIPKDKKTKKDSTGVYGLETLIRAYPNDPILPLILEARRVQKADMYFSNEHVSKDGRLHPTFGFHPNTGRLNSKRPNLNQIPQGKGDEVRAEVAKAVRNTVLATPGFTLAEADWKAIEAVLVGYFADDPDYIRAAKLGIHDILGSHILAQKGIWPEPISLSWDDDKIKAYVKKFKKDYDKTLRPIAKIVAHSSGYGTGEFALSKLLRVSVKEAKFYLEIYNSLAPKVRAWQAATRLRAQKEGFLVNPYGYMRNFFDILRPIIKDGQVLKDKNGAVMVGPTGEEANEVLAFLPQSTAAGILRECILEFDLHQNEDFFPLVPIHDSILFEIKSSKLEEYIGLIQKTMTAPVPQLGGLVIDVELKVGPTWGKMKDI